MLGEVKLIHLLTGFHKRSDAARNTKARFFQRMSQKIMSAKFNKISTGKPNDSILNHGKVLGSTYAFSSVPNNNINIQRCAAVNRKRTIFT